MSQKERILELYEQSESIKKTAKSLSMSESKVRRILVIYGEYKNQLSIAVNKLYAEGCSKSKIARALGVSESAVASYLPYTRGIRDRDHLTENAIRIRECRKRKYESESG